MNRCLASCADGTAELDILGLQMQSSVGLNQLGNKMHALDARLHG